MQPLLVCSRSQTQSVANTLCLPQGQEWEVSMIDCMPNSQATRVRHPHITPFTLVIYFAFQVRPALLLPSSSDLPSFLPLFLPLEHPLLLPLSCLLFIVLSSTVFTVNVGWIFLRYLWNTSPRGATRCLSTVYLSFPPISSRPWPS